MIEFKEAVSESLKYSYVVKIKQEQKRILDARISEQEYTSKGFWKISALPVTNTSKRSNGTVQWEERDCKFVINSTDKGSMWTFKSNPWCENSIFRWEEIFIWCEV